MTGVDDYVSDGRNVVKLSNGHPLLGDITGSGCMVGTAVATLCGVASMVSGERTPGTLYSGDMFLAAISGVLAVTVASEFAAARSDVHGPGTFLPALIDELAGLDANKLIKAAKVEIL
jgi:thiamine-phosphate diphosphorylase / hydroxyethylthiazole kinase